MDYKDYYDILGVSKDADSQEIKKAYRKLARQYHPDANPGDEQAVDKFKEINEAYEVLHDPDKRSKYDQFGRDWARYGQSGSGFDWTQWASQYGGGRRTYRVENMDDLFGGSGGFSDFFETLFGMGATPGASSRSSSRTGFKANRRGQDVETPVQVTLSEAYHGTSRRLNKGGRIVTVKIPPGVRSGSKIRIANEGEGGMNGGPAGDLYLVVDVADDPDFERTGDDLSTTIDVPLYTALLGGAVGVKTLDSNVKLTIPPETQNGVRFRLKNKGMPKLKDKDAFGDLYAVVNVLLPTNLSEEEKELLQTLKQLQSKKD